jgi:molybdopterin/thiamine biosynthesis adenylyltransferase/rhodanese-related sulfurtransferase
MQNNISYERYQRQMILPGFGEQGQQQLAAARVLVIGAGGLGCPALQYLVAAGVGTIGIIDGDTVSLSNLHRQVLFNTDDIGNNKATTAAHHLRKLNPEITILSYPENATTENILTLLSAFDIVIDGTDNFATRYMINDACVLMNKVLVYGAVSRFEGQVAVFNFPLEKESRSSNYRDLFPEPPKENEILNCADAGVMGVLPGMIGSMQASEAIKLITGLGSALINQLLTYNVMTNQLYILKFAKKQDTALLIPQTEEAFRKTDYAWLCASRIAVSEIDAQAFDLLIQQGNLDVVDVREIDEIPLVDEFQHHRIPLAKMNTGYEQLKNDTVVVFCQSGKRSRQAVQLLSEQFGNTKTMYSLEGGIIAWKSFRQKK